jgi:hypothetical protein
MANLALTYKDLGRWAEAEELDLEVIEARRRLLGNEHPQTLSSMHNLAFTLKGQGRDSDALALMEECVLTRKRVFGSEHPRTVNSCAALES